MLLFIDGLILVYLFFQLMSMRVLHFLHYLVVTHLKIRSNLYIVYLTLIALIQLRNKNSFSQSLLWSKVSVRLSKCLCLKRNSWNHLLMLAFSWSIKIIHVILILMNSLNGWTKIMSFKNFYWGKKDMKYWELFSNGFRAASWILF